MSAAKQEKLVFDLNIQCSKCAYRSREKQSSTSGKDYSGDAKISIIEYK